MSEITALVSKIRKDVFEGRKRSKSYYLGLIFLTGLFLVLMLSETIGIVGALGRTVGFFILVILAYGLIDWNLDITENFEFWKDKKELDEVVNLRMKETTEILNRASRGEKVCQETLLENIKEIFFIKLKEKRNLSDEELYRLLEEESEFRKVVQDEMISDFILARYNGEEWTEKAGILLSSDRDPKKNKEKIKEIIRRVERWESEEG